LKCEQLSLLLEVCLFHELGFKDQAITKVITRSRWARTIQSNLKEEQSKAASI
jgi:hypothetical protein